jgi:hypothetical protein
MGEGPGSGMRRPSFTAWIGAIMALAVVQSVVHLAVVDRDGVGSMFDLDRSNGLPDLASTSALAAAALGTGALARRDRTATRLVASALAAALAVLTVADLLHVGAHPGSTGGAFVIGTAGAVVALLVLIGFTSASRFRLTLSAALALVLCSFFVNGLDRYEKWFERERGDPIAEYQIVAKEGLELLGWSLVALALWDEALRRRRARVPTARASRAPAAPTRRAA